MSALAKDTGLSRENLYKALSSEGHPEFSTVMKVLGSLGVELHAQPKGVFGALPYKGPAKSYRGYGGGDRRGGETAACSQSILVSSCAI